MALPRVSVVVPVYNGQAHVRDALHSLLCQTLADFEVIVVDDGSTDETARIVSEVAVIDRRIQLHRQEHRGVVAARNLAASIASGMYLAWLDADDVALPRRIESQVRFMDAHPHTAALGGTIALTDVDLKVLLRMRYPTDPRQIGARLINGNVFAASAAMIRLSAYKSVGGCRPAFQGTEDYDLWLRLSEAFELANLPDLLAYYRVHPAQASRRRAERLVLSTVGAQLSARARRASRPDPYDALGEISYQALLQTASSKCEVDNAVLSVAAGEAMLMTLLGFGTGARALVDWATQLTHGSGVGRGLRAKVQLAYALSSWRARDWPRAALSISLASMLDPYETTRAFARGLRALR